jgi:hypothetical protein
MNVDQRLRALADDDANARVPGHVDAAVMAAWDGHHPHQARRRATSSRRIAAWCAAAAAVLFAGISVFVGSRAVREPVRESRETIPLRLAGDVETARSGQAPEFIASAPAEDAPPAAAPRADAPRPRPVPRARTASGPVPRVDPAYVLVPDADVTGAPMAVMRVRMPRGAFSRLGIPIGNPDGDGMVDVEVLVGHDGVAQSIRRVAAVDAEPR